MVVGGAAGGSKGHNVNEDECDGLEFLKADSVRVKNVDVSDCGTCAEECGAKMNCVILDGGRRSPRVVLCGDDISSNFALIDVGEGGWRTTDGAGGLGG